MIVLRGHPFEWEVARPTAVTIGVFDGVHLGHRRVIADLATGNLDPTILTFDPHPLNILAPERAPKMLTDLAQRLAEFRRLGVQVTGVLSFPDIRNLSAGEFCERVLATAVSAQRVVVGADFRFGRDRGGNAQFLVENGPRLGFEVEVIDMLGTDGEVVSSTRIRQALLAGAVEEAARMLDRPYELRGPVNLGDQRGVELGFPTANISVPDDRLIPGDGIYAAWAVVGEQEHQAAVNIGTRPTFAGADRRVEAHLLDWSGDLYGQSIAIRFIARIRAETKFESAEALAAQIAADVETAGQILEAAKVNPVPHEFGGLTRS